MKITKKRKRMLFLPLPFLLLLTILSTYFGYQFFKKPAEIVSLVSWAKPKTPYQSWQAYGSEFKRHSTDIMTPSYLAALAQTESAGNPLATPKWRFRLTDKISQLYSPASSSVGLYQFTKGTFQKAKNFCIHNGKVETRGCWFNFLYSRLFPSDSIEMASAYLHQSVNKILRKYKISKISLKQKHRLASIIHLCGPEKGELFAASSFNLNRIKRCGSHSVTKYIRRVEILRNAFSKWSP